MLRIAPPVLMALAVTAMILSTRTQADGPLRPLIAWIGSWTLGVEQTIDISMGDDGELVIDGYATYGARDPARVAEGSVQVAAFFARVTLDEVADGNLIRLAFDGGEAVPFAEAESGMCMVELKLQGPRLIARDNGRCGGASVSFTGLYTAPFKS